MKRHFEAVERDLNPAESADYAAATSSSLFKRLGKCEVCAAQLARYTCPKCEVKTCCLRCVNIHKKELDCDGKRDPTKFIPLQKMTERDFMSDYYFLEESTRFVEDRKHDPNKRFTNVNNTLPTHLYRLVGASRLRKSKLLLLPGNFTRHKENTTFYDWKLNKIYWRVEWIFTNAGGLKYVDERCAEDVPLHCLLDKYLNVECSEQVLRKKDLEYYQSVGAFGLKIFLQAEGIKKSQRRFYAMDAAKTLRENFVGKTILEYPCIFLSYETEPAGFEVIDSDEDAEAEAQEYRNALHAKYKNKLKLHASRNDKTAENDEPEKLGNLLKAKKQNQLADYEAAPKNFLFSDEQLLEMLSSDEEGEETAVQQHDAKT